MIDMAIERMIPLREALSISYLREYMFAVKDSSKMASLIILSPWS